MNQSKRIITDVAVVGSGCGAMLAAAQLMSKGYDVALVNPQPYFGVDDLRCVQGLSLWKAAYRDQKSQTHLSEIWDSLVSRLKDIYPFSMDDVQLKRLEHWSVFSRTPVHAPFTKAMEQDYLKLERKGWAEGQVKLVGPDIVDMKLKSQGLRLSQVSTIEGAMVRNHALYWDALAVGRRLSEFVHRKKGDGQLQVFLSADFRGRVGRRFQFMRQGVLTNLEVQKGSYIFLTGGLLPHVTPLLSPKEALWQNGVRRRRREQHLAWFERQGIKSQTVFDDHPLWLNLGATHYFWKFSEGLASWTASQGPDGLEAVVDEALRSELHIQKAQKTWMSFTRHRRHFCLEWEWKGPQWKESPFQTHWATAYEGDLLSLVELLWTMPTL